MSNFNITLNNVNAMKDFEPGAGGRVTIEGDFQCRVDRIETKNSSNGNPMTELHCVEPNSGETPIVRIMNDGKEINTNKYGNLAKNIYTKAQLDTMPTVALNDQTVLGKMIWVRIKQVPGVDNQGRANLPNIDVITPAQAATGKQGTAPVAQVAAPAVPAMGAPAPMMAPAPQMGGFPGAPMGVPAGFPQQGFPQGGFPQGGFPQQMQMAPQPQMQGAPGLVPQR